MFSIFIFFDSFGKSQHFLEFVALTYFTLFFLKLQEFFFCMLELLVLLNKLVY